MKFGIYSFTSQVPTESPETVEDEYTVFLDAVKTAEQQDSIRPGSASTTLLRMA